MRIFNTPLQVGKQTWPLCLERSSLGRWGVAIKDIEGLHTLVMLGSMVFAGVVGSVEDAHSPQVFELTLGIMALHLVKTLIHGF
jgi:hypothetical protein